MTFPSDTSDPNDINPPGHDACFYVIACGIVALCAALLSGYLWGRNDADINYSALVCGNDIRPVVYGKPIDKNWILFQVKNDQPRVAATKKCRLAR